MARLRPFKNKDVFHGGHYNGVEERFTPRTLLEALDDAAVEMDYSNFTTDKLERAKEIIRRYCEEHAIPLGLSRAQREEIQNRKHEARARALKAAGSDFHKVLAIWEKCKRG